MINFMDDDRIKFEERYDDNEYETTTFYFVGDKSLLMELVGNKYSDAEGMTLSIECPTNCIDTCNASVEISPYKNIDGTVTDYEWTDINLPYEAIDTLIDMALSR